MGIKTLTITEKNYHEMMVAIYELMDKGEQNLTEYDVDCLQQMSIAAEKYEDNGSTIGSPKRTV